MKKTTKHTAIALPPTINGYNWEIVGMGKTEGLSKLEGHICAALPNGEKKWQVNRWGYFGNLSGVMYARAIKHPAPKAAKKQPRAKTVKAVRMCASRAGEVFYDNDVFCILAKDVDAVVQGAANEIGDSAAVMFEKEIRRQTLKLLGIIPKRKAK